MSTRAPDLRASAVARIHARRERHRRRPLVVRVLAALAGALLALGGAVLVVPLPEGGLPLLAFGLGVLGLEFDWAARATAWLEWRGAQARASFLKRPWWIRAAILLGLAGVLGGLAYLAIA